jgi:hypothetical protein
VPSEPVETSPEAALSTPVSVPIVKDDVAFKVENVGEVEAVMNPDVES